MLLCKYKKKTIEFLSTTTPPVLTPPLSSNPLPISPESLRDSGGEGERGGSDGVKEGKGEERKYRNIDSKDSDLIMTKH